jgi:hypothetical protein
MNVGKLMTKSGFLIAVAVVLSGCDSASTSTAASPAEVEPKETVQAVPTLPAMPAIPAWVAPYQGKAAKDIFTLTTGETNCLGWFERRNEVFAGGGRYEGWGWNVAGGAPFARVVVTDKFGIIVGGGESGVERKDVADAFPNVVTQLNSGFTALVQAPYGPMIAYGLDEPAKTACELGRFIPSDVVADPAP